MITYGKCRARLDHGRPGRPGTPANHAFAPPLDCAVNVSVKFESALVDCVPVSVNGTHCVTARPDAAVSPPAKVSKNVSVEGATFLRVLIPFTPLVPEKPSIYTVISLTRPSPENEPTDRVIVLVPAGAVSVTDPVVIGEYVAVCDTPSPVSDTVGGVELP